VRLLDATGDPRLWQLSPTLAETVAVAVASGRAPETFGLRMNSPYVLLGPQDMRLPHPERGVAWLEAQGLPVYVRIGGGSAVLLDENCLSFFCAVPCRDISRLDRNFRELTRPVRRALASLGTPVRFGRAQGSYCEGPQDLVTGSGRKLLGVAQALRQGYALVSGMLLLGQDPARTTALLQEFYRRSGSDRVLRPEAVTSLNLEAGREIPLAEVRGAILREAAALGWGPDPSPLSAWEDDLGQQMLGRRRYPAQALAQPPLIRSL
jgi:lipoate-protein ligase A